MARRRHRSYPPSVWGGGGPPPVPATGATAGIPGTWTPPGSTPPASLAALQAGTPNPVTATPATGWTAGQYVQTRTAGAAGRATWTGTGWVGGVAPGTTNDDDDEEPCPPADDDPADDDDDLADDVKPARSRKASK